MAFFLLVGLVNGNNPVKSIIIRHDGGAEEYRLLYKYYRTPERVNALIENGKMISALGIHNQDEINEKSKLYNEEATRLPMGIGFADKMFFNETSYRKNEFGNNYQWCLPEYYDNVESLFDNLKENKWDSWQILLYDTSIKNWTVGYDRVPLKNVIIKRFEDNPVVFDGNGWEYVDKEKIPLARERLINEMNDIDNFIRLRDKVEVKSDIDSELLQKYNELVILAASKGLKITGINYEPIIEKTYVSSDDMEGKSK